MEEPGAGYCPWGRKELDTTERLHFHFSPSTTTFLPSLFREGGVFIVVVYRQLAGS